MPMAAIGILSRKEAPKLIVLLLILFLVGVVIVTSGTSGSLRAGPTKLGDAIEFAEGYFTVGSRARRNNNPGNIKADLIGKGIGFDGPFVQYASYADGRENLDSLIADIYAGKRGYDSSFTILQLARRYAPDPNPEAWAINVAAYLGVSPETRLSELG